MPHSPASRLQQATIIVREAAGLAKYYFERRGTLETETKSGPQDFVSEADKAVETLIRQRLAEAFPGEMVLGEEFGGTATRHCWIIDPIDGTSNFLRGLPLWGISLGYIAEGEPVLGVIALPVLGDYLAGEVGAGVYLNDMPFSRPDHLVDIRLISLGDSVNDDLDQVAEEHLFWRRRGWTVECYHSTSVALAFAAQGRLDGHIQLVTTLWDIAGGAAICRAAGMRVEIGEAPISIRALASHLS
ncbi:myo-inositol-1-monophosphatase [Allorhizobium sp. BGMRC 0089]|uniref:inositol monophosphatase family protein n=1 Tax=Allorhizobium sonneratiae TaxID=2934936 RepID=UPI002033DB97|nr:inositol monophosphatase family protein [Allorhizobium sonneratiae]MCM2293909.1 myo-inositol-1-monophosphatase [Allorhizobium sonneratiae]